MLFTASKIDAKSHVVVWIYSQLGVNHFADMSWFGFTPQCILKILYWGVNPKPCAWFWIYSLVQNSNWE
jgi:hypothetical protein